MKYIDTMKSILFYHSMSEEDYRKIAFDMKKGSLSMIIILSGLSSVIMGLLFFYSFVFEGWSRYRYIYVSYFVLFLTIYFVSKLNKKWETFSPNVTIYSYLIVFYSFTVVDSIILSPEIIALEPIVIYFLVSAFFYFNLIETISSVGIMMLFSSLVSFQVSIDSVKFINITNFILYGCVNIVLSYLITKNYAVGFFHAYKAKEAGYLDSMTGLHNRNYYKYILPVLLNKVKKELACIYIDANDLHRINNESGHEMGDKMLTFIARMAMELAGKEFSFRIGGDEFLCFLPDPEMDLQKRCEEFKENVEKEGFHASIGYEVAIKPCESDMPGLIRSAEKKMYVDKRLFYERTGCDRRGSCC